MTVRKGSAITTPKYKNLDEWSLDDLLVLLGSIGGLLARQIIVTKKIRTPSKTGCGFMYFGEA